MAHIRGLRVFGIEPRAAFGVYSSIRSCGASPSALLLQKVIQFTSITYAKSLICSFFSIPAEPASPRKHNLPRLLPALRRHPPSEKYLYSGVLGLTTLEFHSVWLFFRPRDLPNQPTIESVRCACCSGYSEEFRCYSCASSTP